MIKLGLIGGTGPESTIAYYRGIEYGVQQKSAEKIFPNLVIESLSVFDVLKFCEKEDYDGLTAYLLKGINNLSAAGAEYAALTGITPHIVFENLSKSSPIPLISMIDASRNFVRKQGWDKIGLLGTLPTMNGNFFQNTFAEYGITTVTPTEEEKIYIGKKIETELEFGKVIPNTQNQFCKIANRMIHEEQVQALVLGCTELPLIFDKIQLSVPYVDVMRVHIDTLINLIISD